MNHQQHQNTRFLDNFPFDIYPRIRTNQRDSFLILGREAGRIRCRILLEEPTGSGKTAIAYTILRTLQMEGMNRLFYIVPTKTLVDQVHRLHPDIMVAYGRNEHRCLYYEEGFPADEVPCSLLQDCLHRVDQETGRAARRGARPCPYLLQKYQARQGGLVVCTVSFFLFNHAFHREEWRRPEGLVIDEVHRLAKIVRSSLTFEVSDYHVRRSMELLRNIGANEVAGHLDNFLITMVRIIRRRHRRNARRSILLDSDELRELIEILNEVDEAEMRAAVTQALRDGQIDPREHREVLRRIENIIYDLRRYIRSLEFALQDEETNRDPLNYVYGHCREELRGRERAQYWLFIKSYYVRPVISQRLLSPFTVGMSATIGNPDIIGFETGLEDSAEHPCPFYTFPSTFPVDNTRIFLPTDTPNLAQKIRSRQQPTRVIRQIARACRRFADNGIRSLVVVVSNRELDSFMLRAEEEGVNALSYHNNSSRPRQVAERFIGGEGEVLAGTVANYGEGVDLPRRTAPVIFFLRPGFPRPGDPQTIFEERRFGTMRWALWNWRVMIEALQVRRNVRSARDLGVTFFISQQFRRFLFPALPEWLQDAYRGEQTLEQCIEEAEELLLRRRPRAARR